MPPGYVTLQKRGELEDRIKLLERHYSECSLCPHQCMVNRLKEEKGICRSGHSVSVASYNSHNGEEPPISGRAGSGTIFFSGCSGRCLFCQNYPISQFNNGNEMSVEQLAEIMLELQRRGCHNINLVTPTHFLPSIIRSISIASMNGLRLPIVYNTGGYERVEILALLDGIVDIYLPDTKYSDDMTAIELSGFHDYVAYNKSALKEMYRQTGNLKINDGIAEKGLIVRHLILPENLSGTDDIMDFLSKEISPDLYVSFMDQYFPAHKALKHNRISRRITDKEYDESLNYFYESGLHNGWIQEHVSG